MKVYVLFQDENIVCASSDFTRLIEEGAAMPQLYLTEDQLIELMTDQVTKSHGETYTIKTTLLI